MPRGPNGDYSLPLNVIVSEGQTILPSQHNPALQDIASALTNSLDRNGRGSMLAALDMGGYKVFNLPDGLADGDAATVRQVNSRLSNEGGEVTGTVTSRLLNNILDALASHLTFKRGDGSGIHARIDSVGDGAQGLEKLLLTLVDPSGPSEKTWGINWTNGTLELPGDAVEPGDAVRKSQVVAGPHVAAGYSNLRIDVTGNATVDVDADFLTVFDASGNGRVLRNVDLTINLGNSGANGRDTGSEAANTWYAAYVILNPTTDTVAGLLSTSGTSPTLPSGYTFARRVGWVRNNGSSHLFRTRQRGENVNYVIGTNPTEFPVLASGSAGSVTTPTWVAVSVGSAVPSTAVEIDVALATAGANRIAMVAPNNSYGAHTSTTAPPSIVLNTGTSAWNGYTHRGRLPLESSNIYWASSNHADHALLATGWTDNL